MCTLRRVAALAMVASAASACSDAPAPEQLSGLNANTAEGVVSPSPRFAGGPPIGLRLVASGLVHPLTLSEPPDGSGRLFIVDQIGLIRVVLPNGTLLPQPFLDLRSRLATLRPSFDERGALGLAFHPDYATNGRFFVFYTSPPRVSRWSSTSTVSEFRVSSADSNVADPTSERILLQEDHPQFNHNAGMLAFGPDGYLYISMGDGGGANDDEFGHVPDWYTGNTGGNGQDITQNLLGSILRIDVDQGSPYGIPADNPFVGELGLDEIWAYGFRNPYRFSFDRGGDHRLIVADAGQAMWEEASIVRRGGNYGWNVKEGTHCFDPGAPLTIPTGCPTVDTETGDRLIDPVVEIANAANPFATEGISTIVGGYFYRGSAVPALVGSYVYGAFSVIGATPDGIIFASPTRRGGLWPVQQLTVPANPGGALGHFVLGFGEDQRGEVYVLTTDDFGLTGTSGRIYQLTAPSGSSQ